MRSSVAFALISVNVACWATVAMAEDGTQATGEKRGNFVATAPRQVDTSHGVSTGVYRGDRTSLASLGGASVGTTDSTSRPTLLSATASLVGAGAATASGSANVAPTGSHFQSVSTTSLNPVSAVIGVSAAGVRVVSSLRETVGLAAAGSDRSGAGMRFAGVQVSTVKPMGTGLANVNLASNGIRSEGSAHRLVASVGNILSSVASWNAGLTQGVANAKAAVLADLPIGGVVTKKPGPETPRSVGVWNSANSMDAAIQRPPRVRHTR